MNNVMKQLLIVLFLVGMFVLPVSASQLEGTEDKPATGTTSVTAHVASSIEENADGVKTGDNSHWEEYLLLMLMSGTVILSNVIRLYWEDN